MWSRYPEGLDSLVPIQQERNGWARFEQWQVVFIPSLVYLCGCDADDMLATALYTLTLGLLGFIQAPRGTPVRQKGQ